MTSWERLEQIIAQLGLNVNSFAKEIGLKRSERLYQIKKGNYEISKNLSSLITKRFSTVNEGWLLTGQGEMLKSSKESKKIPLYGIGIEDLPFDMSTIDPKDQLDIPVLSGSDFAVVNNGEAMAPEISHGSLVFVKKTDIDAVLFGDIYLIISEKFNVIRVIREHDIKTWRLAAKNDKDFDDILLPISSIRTVYKVKGVLSMLTI